MSNKIEVVRPLQKESEGVYSIAVDGTPPLSARLAIQNLGLGKNQVVTISAVIFSQADKQTVITSGTLYAGKTETTEKFPVTLTAAEMPVDSSVFLDVAYREDTVKLIWKVVFSMKGDSHIKLTCFTRLFKKVQFMGYQINTAPKMVPDGKGGLKKEYVGIPTLTNVKGREMLVDDIYQRCQLMEYAVLTAAKTAAKTGSPPAEDDNVLKIFMAPEFYFRGPNGAYDFDEYDLVVEHLRTIIEDSKWRNWMFVFGTIIADAAAIDPVNDREVINACLVQMGGFPVEFAYNHCWLVQKEYKSTIDFITEKSNPEDRIDSGVVYFPPAAPSGLGREQSTREYEGVSIFDFNGINFVLDVCLDHAAKRSAQSPLLPGSALTQVQLIPSAGMSINPRAVITGPGGWAFNVDGCGAGAHVELKKMADYHQFDPQDYVPTVTAVQTSVSPPLPAVDVTKIFDSTTAGEIKSYSPGNVPAPLSVEYIFLPKSITFHNMTFDFMLQYQLTGDLDRVLCNLTMRTALGTSTGNTFDVPFGQANAINNIFNGPDGLLYQLILYVSPVSDTATPNGEDRAVYFLYQQLDIYFQPYYVFANGLYCPFFSSISTTAAPVS